jgi:nucleoid-associated protein YgaU
MKKTLILLLSFALITTLTGCVIRSYQYIQERVDQEVKGNRGYLLGVPPPVERKTPATRKMVAVEIELPPYPERDTELWGNLGYVSGEPKERPRKPVLPALPEIQEKIEIEKIPIEEEAPTRGAATIRDVAAGLVPAKVEREEQEEFIEYKVQKGDTLEKIAARAEIYGNPKKWVKIYKANRDKLKSPDRIYPGQIIKIPR